jgi:hypothetical protein
MYLLEDRFAPITSTIGFLECDAATATRGKREWTSQILAPSGSTITERVLLGLSFTQQLEQLLPLTSVIRRRELFVPTTGPWTAYFDNGYRGTDAATPISQLALRLGCRGLRITSVPNTVRDRQRFGRFGAAIFELYGPERTDWLNRIRSIAAVNDGGSWSFSAQGMVLPFEQPERYTRKKVRERFDHELLRSYLEALGIRAFDSDYYAPIGSSAVLLERSGPVAKGEQEYTLEQVRREWSG